MRALSPHNPVSALLHYHAESTAHGFDAGKEKHGLIAWLVVVLPWTLVVGLIYYVLYQINFVLAFLWNVVIVYFTLGFRQFSHYFIDIHLALNNDDVPRAREILSEWTGLDTVDMPVSEIVPQTLVHAVVASHRHVFGVFFWFLIPIDPAGAVFYRIAEYLARTWAEPNPERTAAFSSFAQRAFFIIDWVPVRLTALGFAIVGNFEDAIYAWHNYARQWPDANEGVLLAAGSGALAPVRPARRTVERRSARRRRCKPAARRRRLHAAHASIGGRPRVAGRHSVDVADADAHHRCVAGVISYPAGRTASDSSSTR